MHPLTGFVWGKERCKGEGGRGGGVDESCLTPIMTTMRRENESFIKILSKRSLLESYIPFSALPFLPCQQDGYYGDLTQRQHRVP